MRQNYNIKVAILISGKKLKEEQKWQKARQVCRWPGQTLQSFFLLCCPGWRESVVSLQDGGKVGAAGARLSGCLLADTPSTVELLWRGLLLEVPKS